MDEIGQNPHLEPRDCDGDCDNSPDFQNGDGVGKRCSKCGLENLTTAHRCDKCKAMLPGNQVARKFPALAQASPDLRMSAEETVQAVVADKGGIENMTALKRSAARQLGDVLIFLTLFKNHIVAHGLITPTGKPSPAYDKYLAGLDRFLRLAALLGVEREARTVLSPLDYIDAGPDGGAE
jgi:hypothetical protein